jgi:hypothetical protein
MFTNGTNSNTRHQTGQPNLWAAPARSSPWLSRQGLFMTIDPDAQQLPGRLGDRGGSRHVPVRRFTTGPNSCR